MSVYDSDAFAERVNFAANYIRNKRTQTRRFDTCFEMHDGDAVAVALMRRAAADPAGALAKNMHLYIGGKAVDDAVKALAHVPTKDLKHEAAKERQRGREAFDRMMAKHHPEYVPVRRVAS